MSIAQFLTDPVEPVAADAVPVSWAYPYDDGDPHYLPEDELTEPVRVPGWARCVRGSAK